MLLVASLLTGSVAFHWTSVAEAAVAPRPLSQAALFAGKISLSVDGIGTNDSSGGTVYVEKPEGGTVIAAYVAAASTGFTGYSPVDGDVTIDGAVVRWDADMTMANSISSVNVWADVTSIVKSDIDSAPPGQVGLRVAEPQNTQLIDGEILAVIFEDPGAVADNTVALLYGAQSVFGDTIRLSQPVLPGDSRVRLAMGLGISYGYQPAGQYSELEVNGRRLSTSAGGHDDGRPENGALLSVGGLGDSVANPADPYATDGSCTDPAPPRCDDELYDLLPFLNEGDETINLTTRNPSQDDNVFFAAFQLEGVQAVVGEGVLLTPATARSPVGDTAIYTAIVQDSQGNLTDGRTVTFTVLSGPNEGTTRTETSHGGGQATFIYSSAKEGTDRIVASIVDSTGRVRRSAEVTRVWERAGPDYVAVGDSLTTGFSIRECRDNRKVSPWGCVGSNPPAPPYPDLVAKELGYTSSDSMDLYRKYAEEPGWPPVDLARVGIWGYTIDEATTAYRTGSNVDGPWMPQLRVVDEAQKLVTVTMGFNDMQFSDWKGWLVSYRTGRASRKADSVIRTMGPDLDDLFSVLGRAKGRAASVVVTMMYNPYARPDSVRTRGCATMWGIADLLTGKLNAEIKERALASGFLVADFSPAFIGHGAGSADSYVWGSRCNLSGVLQAASPDWNDDDKDGKRGIQERFDPHPNVKGTKAMADAVLKVVR